MACEGLEFRYPASPSTLIVGFHLSVQSREMVALVGPSGCGKSTLLYLFGLFLHPTSGSLLIKGRETVGMSDTHRSLLRAHSIGFVLQNAALHDGMTIRENVIEGAIYAGASLPEAGVSADALLAVYGIEDISGSRPAQISGGQAQRAALCRALVRGPSLILADEPTGNLDHGNAETVIAGLRAAAEAGSAVVIATHASAVAAASDRLVDLRHG